MENLNMMQLATSNVHALLHHWFDQLQLRNIDSYEQLLSVDEVSKKKAKVTVFADIN